MTGPESRPQTGDSELARKILFALLLLHALFPILWVMLLWQRGPEANDWLHLKIVADHFAAGDWSHLYATGAQAINPGYFWRYPPFALYVVAPLALLPNELAYGLLAALELGGLAIAMILLARMAPLRGYAPEWCLAVVLSAPAFSAVATGQSSALLTWCVVGAASLWSRGRVLPACALLALLAIKPNWGVFFGLYLLVRGEVRGAVTMVLSVVALMLLSLPLGLRLWAEFFEISFANDTVLALYDSYKLITLKGFIDGAMGMGPAARMVWALAALGLVAAAIGIWRRPGSPVYHFGTVLLLAVAANPYASFYDALVLVVPATVWWSQRDQWRRGPWLVVGILVALCWCGEHLAFTWAGVLRELGVAWSPPFSLVGPVASVWLLLEAAEAKHRAATTEAPCADGGLPRAIRPTLEGERP